jgi:acetyl esterase/lipase
VGDLLQAIIIENISQMLQGLNHGYAVVPVDYRLSGEAKFPAAINDAKAAISFIKVNAVQYNLNPK